MAYLFQDTCYSYLDLQTAVESEQLYSNLFYGTEDGYYSWRWDNPNSLSPWVTDSVWYEGVQAARVTFTMDTELQGTGAPAPVYLEVTHYFYTCIEPEEPVLTDPVVVGEFAWLVAGVLISVYCILLMRTALRGGRSND